MAAASQSPSQHAPDVMGTVLLKSEEAVRAQNPPTRHLEQQSRGQLEELIAQVTALREQLGLDVTAAEGDLASRNQSTDVLNTISRFLHEQRVAISQEDHRSQATGSMPGEWMVKTERCGGAELVTEPLHVRQQMPEVVAESIHESIPHQEPPGALATPSERPHVRHPSIRTSPVVLRPVPLPSSVEVPSGERRRDSDVSADHSENMQRHELHRNHSPSRRRRERREQTSSSDSSDQSADAANTSQRRYRRPTDHPRIQEGDVTIHPPTLQRPESVGRNTGGTSQHIPPPVITVPPPMSVPSTITTGPQTGGSRAGSPVTISDTESIVSRREQEAKRVAFTPVVKVHSGPRQRRRSSSTHSSSSAGRSEETGSLGEGRGWYRPRSREVKIAFCVQERANTHLSIDARPTNCCYEPAIRYLDSTREFHHDATWSGERTRRPLLHVQHLIHDFS